MAEDLLKTGDASESVHAGQDAGNETGSTLMTEPGDGSTTERKGGDSPEQGGEPKAEPGGGEESGGDSGKPEPYTLSAPEGYPISEKELADFNRHCLEVGMTREQAEKSLEMLHANFRSMQEQFEAQRRDWVKEIRSDREFGGEHFSASVADAKKALAQFDTDGSVRTMLDATGYGDNPAVIRLFARIGRALGEDRMIGGRSGKETRPLEERLYPNM